MFPKCARTSPALSCLCSFAGTVSRLSLLLCAAVPGPNVSGAGMTGERSQRARRALRPRAPGEFHTHSPLVSHRSCHFPLLSIRAALSQQEGGGLCGRRLPRQRGAPRSTAVERRSGATGGPFQGPAEARWHATAETFAIAVYKRNG